MHLNNAFLPLIFKPRIFSLIVYLPPSAVSFLAAGLFAQLSDFLLFTFVMYNKVFNDRYWLPLSLLVSTKMDSRPINLS